MFFSYISYAAASVRKLNACERYKASQRIRSRQRLYENFMRTKGRRAQDTKIIIECVRNILDLQYATEKERENRDDRDEEPGVVYRLTSNDCDIRLTSTKPGAQRTHALRNMLRTSGTDALTCWPPRTTRSSINSAFRSRMFGSSSTSPVLPGGE